MVLLIGVVNFWLGEIKIRKLVSHSEEERGAKVLSETNKVPKDPGSGGNRRLCLLSLAFLYLSYANKSNAKM